jgi:pimeloyl-ACP methyl ester carboxylesterase
VVLTLIAASACVDDGGLAAAGLPRKTGNARPLPRPVHVRPEQEGVTLSDPAFAPLPGARADFGRLGGSVYQIEVPTHWNGRLVLYMEGYGELRPVGRIRVSPPIIRRYLVGQGFAWGASSFSSSSLIPGRAADETAALWDLFARRYGRPRRTYVTGLSMGGTATHIAAERYGNRFDGALALCGSAGQTPAISSEADFFAAGAYAAGVTQREFDRDGRSGTLIEDRILPAVRGSRAHRRFEDIMISLTGGPRAFAREGFRMEEETNWQRAGLLVAAGLAPNRHTVYHLGPPSPVHSREFNRAVIRLPTDDAALRAFVAGNETSGKLQMPLMTLHGTGDGQVPIEQARILRRRVDAAHRRRLLVQRVIRDPGHCGFTGTEWEAGLEALVRWVERGVRAKGINVLGRRLDDLRPTFELNPRPGTPEADRVPGARRRVVLHGKLTLDGAPFDARWLGAVVRSADGLVTPCQLELPSVRRGRYEITVMADREGSGCGLPGAEIALWTFAGERTLHTREVRPWPRGRRARFDATFASAATNGAVPPRTQFAGQVFRPDGHQLPGGTRIEAYVGRTRCGVTSVRRTGSYSGFSLDVVGPDAVPACSRGATITFRVDGRPTVDTAVNEPARSGSLDLTVP